MLKSFFPPVRPSGRSHLPGTPEQMAAYARSERERWGKLIRDNGITLD